MKRGSIMLTNLHTSALGRLGLRLGVITLFTPGLLLPTATAGVQWAEWTDADNHFYAVSAMPDFDQRRANDDPDKVGFPANGSMYCAPTASANALAYVATHGFPEIDPGVAAWSMQYKYNDSGELILALGQEMGTTPNGGTSPFSMDDSLAPRLQEKFVVTHSHISSTFTPTVGLMAQLGINDHIVIPYYYFCNKNQTADGQLILDPSGGHCVTLAYSKAEDGESVVGFRDPGGGGDLYSQSTFKTRMWNYENEDVVYNNIARKMSRLGSPASSRYLTGFVSIIPKECYSWEPYDNGWSRFRNAIIAGSQKDHSYEYQFNEIDMILDLAPGPNNEKSWILAKQQTFYKLFPISNHDGAIDPSPIDDLVRPTAMAFDRHHTMHIVDAQGIKSYSGDGQDFIGTVPLPSLASKMVVNDQNDTLVVLLPQTGHLATAPVDHSAGLELSRIPTTVTFSDDMDMAINPVDGAIFLLNAEANRLWAITEDRGNLSAEAIDLAGLEDATDIDVDDSGDLLVAGRGTLKAYRQEADSREWRANPDNVRHGAPCGAKFTINRSRSNWIAGTPTYQNVEESGEGATNFTDCPADVTWDRVVDIEDLLVVLEAWDTQGGSPGDITNDQMVNIEDLLLVVGGWGNCSD
ncbi:MAG: hypothetical protein MK116_13640 [Phycisphaerales bacterium]|nr:hypothetical protein [Phycisphaerales bacterium]